MQSVQIEGVLNGWKGRIEEAWGVLTGDARMRMRGMRHRVVGTCQVRFPDAWNELRDARRDAADRIRRPWS